jgi:hypothetical protein
MSLGTINQNTINQLLQVLAPPATVMSEAQMLQCLVVSGVVKSERGRAAIQFAAGLTSSTSTQATLFGLVSAFKNLVQINPDHTPADYAPLEDYLKQITSSGTDVPLTYGLMLQIVGSLPAAPLVPTKTDASTESATTPTGRRKHE